MSRESFGTLQIVNNLSGYQAESKIKRLRGVIMLSAMPDALYWLTANFLNKNFHVLSCFGSNPQLNFPLQYFLASLAGVLVIKHARPRTPARHRREPFPVSSTEGR